MAHPRQTGKQQPPDREPVLRETWLAVIEQLGGQWSSAASGKATASVAQGQPFSSVPTIAAKASATR